MRKMILLALASLASAAAAQNMDCSTLNVGSNRVLNYKEPAKFPDPAKTVRISMDREAVNLSACGYTFFSDGKGNFKYTAPSQDALFRLVNSDTGKDGKYSSNLYFAFVGESGYKYPSLQQDFYSYNVWFIYDTISGEVSTMDYDSETRANISYFKDTSAGYKVNGGPMIPYYYEGKVNLDPIKNASTVDFYALRKNYANGYDRVLIDNVNHSLSFWKRYDFPRN